MSETKLALILGRDIQIPGLCTVEQVKLVDISDPEIFEKYNQYLSIISYNTDDVIDLYKARDEYEKLSYDARARIDAFSLLISVDFFREVLWKALQFFIKETVVYDHELCGFSVYNGKKRVSVIDGNTYKNVRDVILKANYIKVEMSENECVFANNKARAIFAKLKKGRNAKKATGEMLAIYDVVSAVSIQSNSYNLLNIGDLTIYQLYDQFYRLDTKTQIDVCSLKWAAWGTEPFDFSLWYKNKQ